MKKIVIISLSFFLSMYAQEGVGAELGESVLGDGLRQRRHLTASSGPQADGDADFWAEAQEETNKARQESGNTASSDEDEDDKKDVGDQAGSVAAAGTGWGFWPFASQTQEPAPEKVEQTTAGGSIWNLWGLLGGSDPAPAPVIEKSVWNLWGLLGGSAAPVEPTEPGEAPAGLSARRVRRSQTLSVADVPPAQEGEAPAGLSARSGRRSQLLPKAGEAQAPAPAQSTLASFGLDWLWDPAEPAAPTTLAAAQQEPAASPDTGGEGSTGGSAEASGPLPAGHTPAQAETSTAAPAGSEEPSMFSLAYWMYSAGPPAETPVVGLPGGPAEGVSTDGREGAELHLSTPSSAGDEGSGGDKGDQPLVL